MAEPAPGRPTLASLAAERGISEQEAMRDPDLLAEWFMAAQGEGDRILVERNGEMLEVTPRLPSTEEPNVANGLREAATELTLRLALVEKLVHDTWDEDAEKSRLATDDVDGFMSALGHATAGTTGCLEPDEVEQERRDALEKYRESLSLPAALHPTDHNERKS